LWKGFAGPFPITTSWRKNRRHRQWIVFPLDHRSLDGTTNSHGILFFVFPLRWKRRESHSRRYRNPMLRETFVARRGQGAWLNGRKIGVSRTEDISESLLATGFPYDIRESREDNIGYFTVMAKKAQAIRGRVAALDLAYVAAGRFDGFWELKLAPWDTAADA
jgi:myo-inositol-1(or 4)-monophosphatase